MGRYPTTHSSVARPSPVSHGRRSVELEGLRGFWERGREGESIADDCRSRAPSPDRPLVAAGAPRPPHPGLELRRGVGLSARTRRANLHPL